MSTRGAVTPVEGGARCRNTLQQVCHTLRRKQCHRTPHTATSMPRTATSMPHTATRLACRPRALCHIYVERRRPALRTASGAAAAPRPHGTCVPSASVALPLVSVCVFLTAQQAARAEHKQRRQREKNNPPPPPDLMHGPSLMVRHIAEACIAAKVPDSVAAKPPKEPGSSNPPDIQKKRAKSAVCKAPDHTRNEPYVQKSPACARI